MRESRSGAMFAYVILSAACTIVRYIYTDLCLLLMTYGAGYGYVGISNYMKFVFFDYLVRTGKKNSVDVYSYIRGTRIQKTFLKVSLS